MSCNCGNPCACKNEIVLTSTVAVTGGQLVITLPNQNINNNKFLKFVIITAIPSVVDPIPVVIKIGTTNYKMINHCANSVYSDQLRTRKAYGIRLKTDTLLATSQNSCLPCTVHDIPGIMAVIAPTTLNTVEETKGSDNK